MDKLIIETFLYNNIDNNIKQQYNTNIFSVVKSPIIKLCKYIERIDKYWDIDRDVYRNVYIIAIIYLKRLINIYGPCILNTKTVHRYTIIAVLIASKYHIDIPYNNVYYSRIAGLSLNEINRLEIEFLIQIEFKLYISDIEYAEYSNQHDKMP